MPNDQRLKVDAFALAIVALLYAEHLLFGADRVDISLPFAVVHLLILAGLVAFTRGQQPQRLPFGRPGILLGVVFAIGLISIMPLGPPLAHPLWSYAPGAPASISLDPVATRVELIKLAGFTALFLIGAGMGAQRQSAERLANYIVYGGILYSLWAFVAWVTNPHAIFGVPRPYGGDRLAGSFLSANIAGTLFAALATMSLVMLLRPFISSRKPGTTLRLDDLLNLWPQALLLLLTVPCLLLTASRGGLMAFVAAALLSIGCLAWIRSSQRSLSGGFIAVVSVLLCATAVVFLVSGDHTAARLGQLDPLNNDRLQIFAAYWPTIKASPWLGYGLGAFHAFNYASVTLENGPLMTYLGAVHNVYLQWMLQMGLPGVLAMVGCVAVIVAATVRGAARRSSQQTLAIACVGVTAVFAIHSLVDFPLEQPSMAAFFALILGLGYGIAERPSESSRRRG
jgi:O-antigen ligase